MLFHDDHSKDASDAGFNQLLKNSARPVIKKIILKAAIRTAISKPYISDFNQRNNKYYI